MSLCGARCTQARGFTTTREGSMLGLGVGNAFRRQPWNGQGPLALHPTKRYQASRRRMTCNGQRRGPLTMQPAEAARSSSIPVSSSPPHLNFSIAHSWCLTVRSGPMQRTWLRRLTRNQLVNTCRNGKVIRKEPLKCMKLCLAKQSGCCKVTETRGAGARHRTPI